MSYVLTLNKKVLTLPFSHCWTSDFWQKTEQTLQVYRSIWACFFCQIGRWRAKKKSIFCCFSLHGKENRLMCRVPVQASYFYFIFKGFKKTPPDSLVLSYLKMSSCFLHPLPHEWHFHIKNKQVRKKWTWNRTSFIARYHREKCEMTRMCLSSSPEKIRGYFITQRTKRAWRQSFKRDSHHHSPF